MSSFNRVILLGNLTRDPQVKNLPGGTTVAEFGMATNRKFKTQAGEDREEVMFVDVAAFGKQAETIAQWCKKGKALLVEARLKYDSWEDKNGGGKRSKISLVVEQFQFVGGRDDGDGQQQDAPAPRPQRQPSQRPARGGGEQSPFEQEPTSFKDDDIPWAWEGRGPAPL